MKLWLNNHGWRSWCAVFAAPSPPTKFNRCSERTERRCRRKFCAHTGVNRKYDFLLIIRLQFARIDQFDYKTTMLSQRSVFAKPRLNCTRLSYNKSPKCLKFHNEFNFRVAVYLLFYVCICTEVICIHCNRKQCEQSDIVVGSDLFVVLWVSFHYYI